MNTSTTKAAKSAKPLASQTLFRGLDIVSAVADGYRTVKEISEKTGITFSTTHRLASALVQIRYLHFEPRKGYRLGSRLVELGFLAYRESAVTATARPFLEELATLTQDTVHLAALDEDEGIIYLDKIGSQRPIEVNTRIGGRKPVCCTSVGKALILDQGRSAWKQRYEQEAARGLAGPLSQEEWLAAMASYAAHGYTFDMGENVDGIRCVGAPVRDASGEIVASISVTSTTAYTDEARMREVIPLVQEVARKISLQLGATA
ncbi:MAG: IclR family transcriptional regulator [Comamonas sp.]|jgi:DNA-binding IclR family transcriptional regulator|uniref:IclR family transcriptional regulator n=1 Tax=Comamonas sp. TaxID=34028 RepID=UPI002818F764|nr:IclR family transcriptional regulator [Comamonas sp.]MDR0215870.1 IclR family transcriptional regulator [Comamonas sp.]